MAVPVREQPDGNAAPGTSTRPSGLHSERAARIVFAGFLVAAVPIVLFGVGSYHWFFRDDFTFITGRSAGSLDDLFRPSAGHWVTVPLLAFRALWKMFGFRSYLPYQACVLTLHLSVCGLLWVIMRRVSVGPWVATATASAFVLFGPGHENIIWAFQIGMTGSLAFGLVQLVLADHDGRIDVRDILGVVAGALALMSSGVGIVMAIVAGIAIWGRRGWKVATFHVAPLAAMYLTWWFIERPELGTPYGRPSIKTTFDWVRSAETGTFLAIGHFWIVAVILGIALVAGLFLAWFPLDLATLRRRGSIPGAMLIGSVVFAIFTASGRWWLGPDFARSGRYLHIGAALVLPAVAVALDAIVRRWRPIGIAAIALLLLAIPWNATSFESSTIFQAEYMDARREVIRNVVRLREATVVPRDVRPIPDAFVGADLTIGFLLDAVKAGKLDPATGPMSPELRGQLLLRLAVSQGTEGSVGNCTVATKPLDLSPQRGSVYGITTPVTISLLDASGGVSGSVGFTPLDGQILTVELSGLHLRLEPLPNAPSFSLCTVGPA